jgi:hypothetical protein
MSHTLTCHRLVTSNKKQKIPVWCLPLTAGGKCYTQGGDNDCVPQGPTHIAPGGLPYKECGNCRAAVWV